MNNLFEIAKKYNSQVLVKKDSHKNPVILKGIMYLDKNDLYGMGAIISGLNYQDSIENSGLYNWEVIKPLKRKLYFAKLYDKLK